MTHERDRDRDRDRDDNVLDDMDYIQPVGGVGGVMVPPAENSLFNPEVDIPENEQDTSDEYVAPEDEGLLHPGDSPEFDHSLRRRKPSDER
jgi:hypothetical protein